MIINNQNKQTNNELDNKKLNFSRLPSYIINH